VVRLHGLEVVLTPEARSLSLFPTGVYAKVGGNATFSVQPPVMHFGGYELGRAVQADPTLTPG
jgi:hypothetical protein